MAKSDRQKSLKKKMIIFGLSSTLCWVVTAIVFTCLALSKFKQTDVSTGIPIFSNEIKALVVSVGITVMVGLMLAMIIKDKLRTFIYMASLIIAWAIYRDVGMFTVLGIWFTDEYVLYKLYTHYKNKYQVRKEIDLE